MKSCEISTVGASLEARAFCYAARKKAKKNDELGKK
jgi:hypothetical protein